MIISVKQNFTLSNFLSWVNISFMLLFLFHTGKNNIHNLLKQWMLQKPVIYGIVNNYSSDTSIAIMIKK